jgi:hypothetical protein
MLGGFAGGAAMQKRKVSLDRLRIEEILRMGIEPGAVTTSGVKEEEFGG